MKFLLLPVLLGFVSGVQAQYAPPADHSVKYAEMVTGDQMSEYLHVLASDDFEGRETGTPGNDKAAHYIADQFKKMGIPPVPALNGYFQKTVFSNISIENASLKINDLTFSHLRDFIIPMETMPGEHLTYKGDEILFLGYGIDDPAYSDYGKRDVRGKAIFIYNGEPQHADGRSWITGTTELSPWSTDLHKKLRVAADHGVALVIVVEDHFRARARAERMQSFGGYSMMGEPSDNADLAPNVLISPTLTGILLGKKNEKVNKALDRIRTKGKPKAVKIPVALDLSADKVVSTMRSQNVLGYIEGTDPALKDQLIILTAHYDHLGKRGNDIYNGADDDGSGTSAVMTIARAFEQAKKDGIGPRRSVLCMLMTGEEKGLLGSEYYSEFPVFPLDQTVSDINIDMIGRMDDKHTDPNYTYVIGSGRLSTELHDINEAENAKYTHLTLDYGYDSEDDPNRFYYRSDHYNFAKHGIPVIFFFTGVHEDYHRPTDTVDKIMFPKAAKIARLAFHTVWELANRDERIKVDKE